MSRFAEHARFLTAFIRNPRTTGSLVPSSQGLAKRMVEGLDLEHAQTIVEIGPGTGAFTGEIMSRAKAGAKIIAIELDATLAGSLQAGFPTLEVVHDSAEALPKILDQRGIRTIDAVACSLPWANFPDGVSERILDAITGCLRPGGRFSSYVYLSGLWMPGAWKFRKLLRHSFATVDRSPIVWANVPPAFVCRCTTKA